MRRAALALTAALLAACGSGELPMPTQRDAAGGGDGREWIRTVTVPAEGRISRACFDRNGKTRFITRYKVAELGATQHVRYKTSRGAEAVRTLHPGERMRSTSVGRRGEIDWFIVERSKPESTRTHYTIDYHRRGLATDPGCWHLPFAKVTRRSDAH